MARVKDEFTEWMHRTRSNNENSVWEKPKVVITQEDISKIKADAIVNAANSSLLGGSGVDWAIRQAGGLEIQRELQVLREEVYPNGLEIGKAISTFPGKLNTRIVIHTVGPRYYKDNPGLLKDCYVNSLKLAEENGCKSIAFPAISTGAYGLPIEKSAEIVKSVLENYQSNIVKEVILVLWKDEDLNVYKKELEK